MMKLFYLVFLVIISLNVFYVPHCFTDRFFTAGMLWVGMAVGVLTIVWLVVEKGKMWCTWESGIVCLVLMGLGVWDMLERGMWQSGVYGGALVLLIAVVCNSGKRLSFFSVCWIFALMAGVEALMAFGQFAGVLKNGMQWQAVGSFDNPAGLSAYLALAFPCVLYLFRDVLKWRRLVAGCLAGIIVFAVVLSGARTGMLVIAVESFVTAWYIWGKKNVAVRRWFVGMAVLLVAGGIVLYYWKKDSADGRLLIWKCTADMIADAPWFGHGIGSFNAKYMDYQADFFESHPEGKWGLLADNVKHPFNEFLKICAEFGIVGLLSVCVGLWMIWRKFGQRWRRRFPLFVGLLGLLVCGLFSYPLSYPSIQVSACILLGMILRDGKCISLGNGFCKLGIGIVALLVLAGSCFWHWKEQEWWKATQDAYPGNAEQVHDEYARLYPVMKGNPLFLYNYGAELNRMGLWKESHEITLECLAGWNDMDVHMLLAGSLEKLGNYGQSEEHLLKASNMCPNRFMPLYRLMKLYRLQGKVKEAESVALKIITKQVKVPSGTVDRIKREAKDLLKVSFLEERQGMNDLRKEE